MLRLITVTLLYICCLGHCKHEHNTGKDCRNICNHLRIVGGCPAKIKDHPYQVSIEHVYRGHFCGGSILSKHWIVTAAHCVKEMKANQLRVRAGTSHKHEEGTVRKVHKIVVHRKFHNFDFDVALLKVEKPFHFDKSVQQIAMASTVPDVGTCVTVSGWGYLELGGHSPLNLHHVEILIIDHRQCASSYHDLTPQMICAGWPRGGRDSCYMDSGGPLVFQKKLVGIVSWGYGCALAGYPGVYTNVAVLKKWIREHMK
ncbi:trypsin-7-like [Periplaneta americana]|uniref:trypsin-7-like n=1 Tax=Periplaneta americana TaxID=6978 RepID=UPI0037E98B9F